MPSFRVTLPVHTLRPARRPPEVMEALLASVGSGHHVDDHRVDIVEGKPVVRARFSVGPGGPELEDAEAVVVARRAARDVGEVATCGPVALTRRIGNRWEPVRF